LSAEVGLPSKLIACTTVEPVDPAEIPPSLKSLNEAANCRFVAVHNY
jgi:hypothetical protein